MITIAGFSGGEVVSTANPLSCSRATEIKFPLICGTCNTSVRTMLLTCPLTRTEILTLLRAIPRSVDPFAAVTGYSMPSNEYSKNAPRSGVIWLVTPESTCHPRPLRTLSDVSQQASPVSSSATCAFSTGERFPLAPGVGRGPVFAFCDSGCSSAYLRPSSVSFN